MGLFKKKIDLPYEPGNLYSITNGKLIGIEKVEDEMFAQKIMGDGVAFISNSGEVVSPCNGTVLTVFDTCHAIGLATDDGVEVLIHIGIDTVKEQGKGFKSFVKNGEKVKRGQKLITFDMKYLESKGYDLSIPMIVTNMDDITGFKSELDSNVTIENKAFSYTVK
ncbi:PTS sugar transporter subunit IIA [Konateibacter massiliensis]|uniref:PTS sugar transporter subunit IIA n=1 Tax=Konateibacter massiliensis TaxID=2002841 RepID=UPI000C15EF31|nr:PTS glucose transporter subunit IIA [Konateibacter massiliensis]